MNPEHEILRDQIADVIKRVDCKPSDDANPYLEMADAVIAELGLYPCGDPRCECRQCRVERILEADDE